ncbi:hypothetical protein [Lampropedia cohaerens]|uniref:hypothetical protein n=1 Tax=Lampropedia cohaerens TaxID=1610491 RepID=UPI0012DFEC9C|nr:hypothetical protein [Lampropedia cohaerens]
MRESASWRLLLDWVVWSGASVMRCLVNVACVGANAVSQVRQFVRHPLSFLRGAPGRRSCLFKRNGNASHVLYGARCVWNTARGELASPIHPMQSVRRPLYEVTAAMPLAEKTLESGQVSLLKCCGHCEFFNA